MNCRDAKEEEEKDKNLGLTGATGVEPDSGTGNPFCDELKISENQILDLTTHTLSWLEDRYSNLPPITESEHCELSLLIGRWLGEIGFQFSKDEPVSSKTTDSTALSKPQIPVVGENKSLEQIDSACINWLLWSGGSKGKYVRAHLDAWEKANGPIPKGLFVLHHCDNPSCVNVDHLFLGDNQANSDDKVAKGRQCRGESRPAAKLTAEAVREIRSSGLPTAVLAKKFNVHPKNIRLARRGITWKHVS